MKLYYSVFFTVLSHLSYGQIQSDRLFLCDSIQDYISRSGSSTTKEVFSRHVIVVHETNSKYVFSVVANSIDLEWIEVIKDCHLTQLSNNYVLIISPTDFKNQWPCLDLIDTNPLNIQVKLKEKMFNVERLEYSTLKFPSYTLLRWLLETPAIPTCCFLLSRISYIWSTFKMDYKSKC